MCRRYSIHVSYLNVIVYSFPLKTPEGGISQSITYTYIQSGINAFLLLFFQFLLDLMECGRQNKNIALEDLVVYSAAPLATAVSLSRALCLASVKEKVQSNDLQAAAQHCEIVALKILKLASSAKDVDAGMVLRAVDHRDVSMLDCLIEGRQKQVVSIPAVQEYLTNVWYGSMHWASWKILLMFFCLLICFPLWPVLVLLFKRGYSCLFELNIEIFAVRCSLSMAAVALKILHN